MDNGTDEHGGRDGEENSDLFSVSSYGSGTSIPVITKVPLTKEEIRKRKLLRITYVVIAALLAAFAVWLFFFLRHLSAVDAAVHAAGDDGRVASIQEALELMDGDDDAESQAIKLRLRVMLLLAGEDEPLEPLSAELAALPEGDSDVAREHGIANTYLALVRGDLQAAMNHASSVVAQGSSADEAACARAMAARAVGNVDTALAAARIAVELRPESSRHVALFAELTARQDGPEAALAMLDELPADAQNAGSRIARARIMDRAGADIDQVAEQARAVLEDDGATRREKAWARLLLARAAAAAGDRVTARQQLNQANEVAPPGDESFTLGLAEAALRIGATVLAANVATRLPSPLSVDAGRRAQLTAELALAQHSLRAADAALEHAPADARTRLARARILQARGSIDEARELYRAAAAEPAYRVPATVHLAAMELERGDATEAAARVQPLLQEHPNHPDVVPVAVEAQLGLGRAAQAMELVTPALAAHPGDVRLLAAKAHVQMALEQWEEALSTLDSALGIEDDDADLHADRGRAARKLSRLVVAREAFDRALELSPSHPVALVGHLELDLLDFRPAQGRTILARIDEAELDSIEIERLRGRLLTMEIAGHSGIDAMREAQRTYRDDLSISLSLGWLYMQAEQYSTAVRTFTRFVGGDDQSVEAVLGRSLAQIRMRAGAPARAALDNLVEDLDEETLDAADRAELHAVLGRLAWSDHDRAGGEREAQAAIAIDRRNSEAHLILAEIADDRQQDSVAEYEAALIGRHPASRSLAVLAMREQEVTPPLCEQARRYRRAAPAGQYARGVWRVMRDCRHLEN